MPALPAEEGGEAMEVETPAAEEEEATTAMEEEGGAGEAADDEEELAANEEENEGGEGSFCTLDKLHFPVFFGETL